jgi:hypothetical protein
MDSLQLKTDAQVIALRNMQNVDVKLEDLGRMLGED